jgi:beta-lactamase class A
MAAPRHAVRLPGRARDGRTVDPDADAGRYREWNVWMCHGGRLSCAAVAVALAVSAASGADAREPRLSAPYDVVFGRLTLRAPAGSTSADLVADGRLVATQDLHGRRRVSFLPELAPGRYDLRVRFRRTGAVVARLRSANVWLLLPSASHGRRERARDPGLSARLARLGRAFPGWAGLWTHDLTTGRTAGWNADAPFPAASTVKLGVIVAALQRAGPRPERSAAWPLIRDVATWSSNDASNKLLLLLGRSEAAGAAVAQRTLWRLGARASTFTGFYRLGTARSSAAAIDAPRPLPFLAYRRTTAHDLGRILVELHLAALGNRLSLRRTGLSVRNARLALGLLLSSSPRGANLGLFRPALGPGRPAAQKQGWTTSLRHSAAIVYAPQGPRIVVLLTYRPSVNAAAALALGGRFLEAIGMETVRRRW